MKKILISLFFIVLSGNSFAQEQSYRFFVLDPASRSSAKSSADLNRGNICGRVKDENYAEGYSDEDWLPIPIEVADQSNMRNLQKFFDRPSDFEFNAVQLCEYIMASSDDAELLKQVQKISAYREVPR